VPTPEGGAPAAADLRAEAISFAYSGRDVLDAVSAGVSAGELVGVLGPNGSGKTTLLRCLLDFVRPRAGRVLLDGRDVSAWTRRAYARRVAAVPQEMPTDFPLRVGELVLLGRLPHLPASGVSFEGSADHAAAAAAMEACGVAALSERPLHALSGGELRRVFVARALAQAAPVLLLDEPTSGLDLRHQLGLLELLRRQARAGTAVMVVLHDVNLAAAFCDRVVVLKDGQVAASGTPDEALCPETLAAVYEVDVHAVRDGETGRRLLVPSLR